MPRRSPIRPVALALAAGLILAPLGLAAQTAQDRWQAQMDPAGHAHMLGNFADAEDHYLEAIKLAEKFDRLGEYLERSMAGLGGLYYSAGRYADAVPLYRRALTIAEAVYDPGNARHGVIAIYRETLAAAEAARDRMEAAGREALAAAERDRAAVRARPRNTVPAGQLRAPAVAAPSPPAERRSLPVAPPAPAAPLAASPAADLPPPPTVPSLPVLSHYRLAGAVIPPPPPAEVLPAVSPPAPAPVPASASVQVPASPSASPHPVKVPARGTPVRPTTLPPAVEAAEVSAPEAVASPAAPSAPSEHVPLRETPVPAPPRPSAPPALPPAVEAIDAAVPDASTLRATPSVSPSAVDAAVVTAAGPAPSALPPAVDTTVVTVAGPVRSALPPAVDAVEVTAAGAATEVPPAEAEARLAGTEALPLRGSVPRLTQPSVVAPAEAAPVSQIQTAETGAPPAEVRSWAPRSAEVAGRPVDAAAVRAIAADPAAPPDVLVRAIAVETPQEIAQRKALEERHPVLGIKLGPAKRNTGPIFPDTPRLADTEDAYVAQLEALERSLGPNHPDVAKVHYKLARLYQRQGRYELAGKMYERCLAVREKVLPDGHPDTVETLDSYARLLRASGFSELAAEVRERARVARAQGK